MLGVCIINRKSVKNPWWFTSHCFWKTDLQSFAHLQQRQVVANIQEAPSIEGMRQGKGCQAVLFWCQEISFRIQVGPRWSTWFVMHEREYVKMSRKFLNQIYMSHGYMFRITHIGHMSQFIFHIDFMLESEIQQLQDFVQYHQPSWPPSSPRKRMKKDWSLRAKNQSSSRHIWIRNQIPPAVSFRCPWGAHPSNNFSENHHDPTDPSPVPVDFDVVKDSPAASFSIMAMLVAKLWQVSCGWDTIA